jgi:hypothetical protein
MSLRFRTLPRHCVRSMLTGPRLRRRGVAVLATIGLAAGFGLLDQSPSGAAGPVSQSQGTFLDGSVLGSSLSNLASVLPASATNSGGAQDIDRHPLDVTALNAVNIPLGNGLNLLGNNGILQLGAVNQYAEANPDGSSRAASGAVNDTGGVEVGGTAAFPSDAKVSLKGLIGPGLASSLADLNVTTGALSATATQTAAGVQTGGYQIAGLTVDLTSPLVAGITGDLSGAVAGLQTTVNGLTAAIEAIPGVSALVQVTLPDLSAVLNDIDTVSTADGSITANLQTGAVSIDLAKVLASTGLDLNNLDPDTNLLPYITDALTNDLLPAIAADITGALSDAINATSVTVLGIPLVLPGITTLLQGVVDQVSAPISTAVANLGDTVVTPLATALGSVLSLTANVQETAGGMFTERALQVGLLPTTTPPTAIVNLASATVGPNAGPAVAPTASGLAPDHGPQAGGTSVTVTGTGFVPGSTSVTIGGNTIPAGEVTVTDPTSLTFTTPAHDPGPVDVTVTTAGGTSTPALTYTYDPAAAVKPTTSGLDPDHGPQAGGTSVTVTGTGFVPGSTSVTIGGNVVSAAEVTVTDPTSLTFTTPAHDPGPVDVTITTAGGTSTPALSYTYDPAAAVKPTTSGLDPDHGPAAGGQTVTVTGTGFVPGSTTVTIGGKTIPAAEVTVTSPTTLTFTTPAHNPGGVTVTVTTPGGTSSPLPYTYDGGSSNNPAPPVITDPTDGSTTTDPTPPISGTGTSGSTVTVTEGGTIVCTALVGSDGHWTCKPASALSSGEHTIVATQKTESGAVSGPSAPVHFTINATTTQSGGATGLAFTGLAVTSLVTLGLVLAAAGAMLVTAGRRRRTS